MHLRLQLITTVIGFAGVLVSVTPTAAQRAVFSTTLTGKAEKPNPGDPNGYGVASLILNPEGGYICYSLFTSNIEPATGAHIHKGTADEAGPVVVPLTTPSAGLARGCVDVEQGLIQDIQANPSGYYVNVHNDKYREGAIRGQVAQN